MSFLRVYKMPVAIDVGGHRTVLVVDDDADFRKIVTGLIRSRIKGVVIHQAGDGFLAGKKVEELKPDVVVLDLRLPGIDGFKVCEHIRRDPDLARTRIVVISGMAGPEARRRILQAGADVFLSKPLGISELAETVEKLLAGETVGAAG